LVERYKKELEKQIPEVDLFIPIKEYDKFWDKIEELIGVGTDTVSAPGKIANVIKGQVR